MDAKDKKYEFTGETCKYGGVVLHRIRALKDISKEALAGEIGGWLENESNLSQDGTCWVGGNAKVYGQAEVYEDATVFGRANVCGKAKVFGNAQVYGYVKVYGEAEVSGYAEVYGNAIVYGNARVRGCVEVYGSAEVHGDAEVYDHSKVFDNAEVFEHAKVYGYALVYDNAKACGYSMVCSYTELNGYAKVTDGELKTCHDYITVGPIGSRDAYTTFNFTTGTVQTGCFKGTLNEFEKAVKKTHKGNGFADEYNILIAYFRTLQNTSKNKSVNKYE